MKQKRHKKGYKFTEKTHSKKGMLSFGLAAASIAVFIYGVCNSFQHDGAGSMYLGSAGVTSMLLAVVSTVFAVMSLKEEESFKLFPYLATFTSFLASAVWIAIYVIGFML